MVNVEQAIAYIESCGYKLVSRARGYYRFYNPNRHPAFQTMIFRLSELRETYRNGW